ncbi:hypothetical protein M5689_015674 [Euphorbia peplus]|nr:hypothetical protein M5689_015674 [Euphorbia peplus]
MPIKNITRDSNPLPYCYISKPLKNFNLNIDNCFSPQAKNQSPIFSPRNRKQSLNVVVGGSSNVSYPYYMPEKWFTEVPPMGIQVEEREQEEEEEQQNENEINKLSNLSMPVKTPLENLIGETPVRKKGRGTTSRGVGRHGPVEELSHRLERFKIKTLQLGGGGGVAVKK